MAEKVGRFVGNVMTHRLYRSLHHVAALFAHISDGNYLFKS